MEILRLPEFDKWLAGLRDDAAVIRIIQRLDRLQHGNRGDYKYIGRGVMELRITHGPGYRVYYVQRGNRLVVLLCGGDKSSQAADIRKALALAERL
ncbi:MAG: type II toxin-antitoxin system RelE/ParE family toxin [Hyphomicrobiales bacterium]|nr:MAG: type II toxin-antitoxin system RelE/ParE family toxin [Hyphomicrobiales bacterium]